MKRWLKSNGLLVVLAVIIAALLTLVLCTESIDSKIHRCEQKGGVYFRQERKCLKVETIPMENP